MSHRRTKIAGLVLFGVGGAAMGLTGGYVTMPGWLLHADRADVLWAGLSWWAGGNLFALGLILLLAGLREVPLGAGSRGRRGVLVKLAGANLILLAFVVLGFEEYAELRESWAPAVALLAGLILAAGYGIRLLRTGWKYEALSADVARARDPRPPVVYLRSFHQDEELTVAGGGGPVARTVQRILRFVFPLVTAGADPEQELATLLHRVGPVIAIGQPGESLPDLGAARMYVRDDQWRATVDELLTQSALVLIRAGATPNLWWEIEEAMKLVPRQRILIVSLLDRDGSAAFDRLFVERFGAPTRLEAPPVPPWLQIVKKVLWYRDGHWRLVFFDDDGRPRDVPIASTITWSGFGLQFARPYRDMFFSSIKRVFAAQGRPWVTPRTHTTAVLLALFGGTISLHKFYLGDPRRGWRRLPFCVIGVPVVLGWIDAVRLALIDGREFDRRYPGPAYSRVEPDRAILSSPAPPVSL